MKRYYPVNLALEGRRCVVVGAGRVAERKARRLLACGAGVSVIAVDATPGLRRLAREKKISLKQKKAGLKDLTGAYLVIAATSDRALNASISSYCLKNDILVNIVDSPDECSFILPSVVKRGDLVISISTGGISPALAKKVRVALEAGFGDEYAKFLRLMEEIRPLALNGIKDIRARKDFFDRVLHAGLLGLIKKGKLKEAKRRLKLMLENAKT
ncbi:MAG: hypothetical protein AUJ75_00825 [Candidatus Omnitrophica bacterium CG1_02_49_10]|nr:MAG: hypothetical protein AUJ75_00825 [Candidatus Omnitrophica bacterium CG1_02_49_10]